ncbi:MAG: TonB-dependent receptor [Tannerellaceae bacterium]|nr:TonB-dependent receptor [Tannerellaceae bacterium]
MRLTFIAFLLCVTGIFATEVNSQTARVSFSMQNARTGDIIEEIEKQTDFLFLYAWKEIDLDRRTSLEARNQTVAEVLTSLFRNTDIVYAVEGTSILLMRNGESEKGLLSAILQQQNRRQITGKVTDEQGEPLIGANVSVKGTTTGNITNVDGEFTLSVPEGAILAISYIGYVTQEVSCNDKTVLNIRLENDAYQLDEVVAIGFGSVKKVNLTGAVSALGTKEIEKLKVTQTSQLLAGIISGINVTQGSGQPGFDGAYVRIRGLGTFSSAGNEPLVLIDGISSSLNKINVNDIESISVLKDAASASIYGTRAANGVILIETKKGKEGKAGISYQGTFGFTRAARKAKIVDSRVYAEMYNDALVNAGGSPQYSEEEIVKFQSGEDPDNYANKRHYDDLISSGSGFQTNHHLSFAGGTENTSYMFSLSYMNQEGIVAKTNYKRYNVMFNVSSNIFDNFKINARFSGQKGNHSQPTAIDPNPVEGIEGIVEYSIKVPNTIAGRKSNGYYGQQTGFTIEGWMDSESFIKNNDVDALANTSFEWNILKDLKLTGVAGYNFTSGDRKKFRPTLVIDESYTASPSVLQVRNTRSSLFTIQTYLDYDLAINSHQFHFLSGYSQESYKEEYVEAYRDNFPSNSLYEINAGAASNQQNTGSAYEWALESFFGRINYSYLDKYLLEFNARYDGSSRFPKKNRFGLFPSISGGWNISREDFFNFPVMSNLKLRASYGKLGNQNIGNYPYQQVISLGVNAPFGKNEVLSSGAAATVVPSMDITWESTQVTNLGLDVGLFENKLSFTADIYHKKTTDILYNITASTILGMTPSIENAGTVTNKGIDFNIQHKNRIGDFSYTLTANTSYVQNEVTKLSNVERDVANGYFVGHSLKSIYGYVTDGFFNSQEEVDGYAIQPRTANPGDLKLVDISGPDGVPDGVVNADYDRKIIGATFPKYNFGFNVNMQYKNIDFLLNMSGVAGINRLIGGFQNNAFLQGSNPQEWMVKGKWTEDNQNATYPRFQILGGGEQQFYTSTFTMYNASFLRINDIQAGYTLPVECVNSLGISNLRVYVSVKNLVTIDNFLEGWDPERTTLYPSVRDFMAGLSVTF